MNESLLRLYSHAERMAVDGLVQKIYNTTVDGSERY